MLFRRKKPPVSWIVAFLGNPGLRYENTRHNVGFVVADLIADKMQVKVNRSKWNALTATIKIGYDPVLLLKPQTYMNLSGNSVKQALNFYNMPLEKVIVVSDDVSLPVGKLRIRRSGSSGGHNGIRDIISKCGGDTFPRIRIGVGSPPIEDFDMADWVLSKISDAEQEAINASALNAAAALEMIIEENIDRAMTEFN